PRTERVRVRSRRGAPAGTAGRRPRPIDTGRPAVRARAVRAGRRDGLDRVRAGRRDAPDREGQFSGARRGRVDRGAEFGRSRGISGRCRGAWTRESERGRSPGRSVGEALAARTCETRHGSVDLRERAAAGALSDQSERTWPGGPAGRAVAAWTRESGR